MRFTQEHSQRPLFLNTAGHFQTQGCISKRKHRPFGAASGCLPENLGQDTLPHSSSGSSWQTWLTRMRREGKAERWEREGTRVATQGKAEVSCGWRHRAPPAWEGQEPLSKENAGVARATAGPVPRQSGCHDDAAAVLLGEGLAFHPR